MEISNSVVLISRLDFAVKVEIQIPNWKLRIPLRKEIAGYAATRSELRTATAIIGVST